jgi:phosphatidylinositol 4-kinase
MDSEFSKTGLELYVRPYGVVPTGHECGIIEVVPNAKSRAQLVSRQEVYLPLRMGGFLASDQESLYLQGELADGGLYEIFQHEFGLPGSKRFEAARDSFIKSSAG